ALSTMADTHFQVILPGCTHLQHAQPVLLAHHLLAYVEMFHRDHQRFGELRKRVNVMPLGSAALAGTTYPINRKQVADELDFDAISVNSMDAVSDRDYLIEFCSNAALVMMHLSRFSDARGVTEGYCSYSSSTSAPDTRTKLNRCELIVNFAATAAPRLTLKRRCWSF
ncbi:MAG: hypothetical protein JKY89_14015, partial [Immundisolibacteraceae bacterium]|nr:hypothetical protein [Immundisolibacteraceae bacterium]